MKKLLALCALITAALIFMMPSAWAGEDHGTTMQFTIQDMTEGGGYPIVAGWYLGCDPARGTHPDIHGACDTLEVVDGWAGAVKPNEKAVCTKEYKPVQVSIEGFWNNRAIWYWRQFDNRCLAAAGTSNLFPAK